MLRIRYKKYSTIYQNRKAYTVSCIMKKQDLESFYRKLHIIKGMLNKTADKKKISGNINIVNKTFQCHFCSFFLGTFSLS